MRMYMCVHVCVYRCMCICMYMYICMSVYLYAVSLFMVSACYWRGSLCFGRGIDRGFVFYISLFLRVLGWCVCVCLYMRVHTHKLLGYLMWAQVWDGHLEGQKNPDRLKRSTHVDRITGHCVKIHAFCTMPCKQDFTLQKRKFKYRYESSAVVFEHPLIRWVISYN